MISFLNAAEGKQSKLQAKRVEEADTVCGYENMENSIGTDSLDNVESISKNMIKTSIRHEKNTLVETL